ncbi:monocarboxylate transporter 13-like [Asterias rubens]|uniref:monocarboxylate transporter 13-like n=1 Tax=Asterias rubens TaxID=7604 RepID=UPI0014553A71|nr:monocarboxylate transporter 13-like [Asterias rubens]
MTVTRKHNFAHLSQVDRGWAWAVLLGVHVCNIFGYGYLTTLGLFFTEWKEYFDESATATSLLLSLPWMVASPFCFFIGVIASRFGIRRVAMTGALINGSATILGSLTKDMWQLYMCNALSGVGVVMMLSSGMIIISQYFKTRFAIANGIAVAGVNVGQIMFTPLFRFLIDTYGWRGTMFITGALQMNCVAASALFRPLKTHNSNGRKPNNSMSINMHVLGDDTVINDSHKKQKSNVALKIFTNVKAMLLILATCVFSIGLLTNLAHLPARCKEGGWSDDQSGMLLLSFAITAMITRPTHGWFVDNNYIGCFKLQLIVLISASLITFTNPVSNNYIFLIGYSAVLGALLGIGCPLLIVNMKSLVNGPTTPAALSLIWATVFLFNGVGSVVAGKLYDATGNYVVPFLTAGAMFLAAFLLVALITVMKRRQDLRELQLRNNVQCQSALSSNNVSN